MNSSDSTNKRYYRQDLELMTTHQLREICRREKIINGILNPLDKEELIHVIIRYRGAEEQHLVREYDEAGHNTIQAMLAHSKIRPINTQVDSVSKITVYEGIATNCYDGITISYDKRFIGTNALVVGGSNEVCAVFNVEQSEGDNDWLYLTMSSGMLCQESPVKRYRLFLFSRASSDVLFEAYTSGNTNNLPENLELLEIPLLDFQVRLPAKLTIPVVIDFGTSNTVAGVFLDRKYFEDTGRNPGENGLQLEDTNYTLFYDTDNRETALLPSIVGVKDIESGQPNYVFGYQADKLSNLSYVDESFCVFYDIKRWIIDYEKCEGISDRTGQYLLVSRKEIIKQYLLYVIEQTKNRFKCEIDRVHISCPVKQKYLFQSMFSDILPDIYMNSDETLDEGTAVLYNTISERIKSGNYSERSEEKALIIDCGGGTTDLSSCVYSVENSRVSYKINIKTAYENGETNFGGGNLTYRIMQLLKLELAAKVSSEPIRSSADILERFDTDIYRAVDDYGIDEVYSDLEHEYSLAESIIPTRFKDYESKPRADYYKVKNNFYYLFSLSEQIKRAFFKRVGILRVCISDKNLTEEDDTSVILADKWKLSILKKGKLDVVKEFPEVSLSIYDVELLLKPDVYNVVHQFLNDKYEQDELYDYSIMKLSGQSCKIGVFADAIKEFIPGKIINYRHQARNSADNHELKMNCVSGALQYLKDKKFGYADVSIENAVPAIPYIITARTHSGREKTLISSLDKTQKSGSISRNMDDLSLELFLKDVDNRLCYSYIYRCEPDSLSPVVYEEIEARYEAMISQDDTDVIVDREVKFFVWAKPSKWGYVVVPVCRIDESLLLGKEKFFSFENEIWVRNFFDGTH